MIRICNSRKLLLKHCQIIEDFLLMIIEYEEVYVPRETNAFRRKVFIPCLFKIFAPTKILFSLCLQLNLTEIFWLLYQPRIFVWSIFSFLPGSQMKQNNYPVKTFRRLYLMFFSPLYFSKPRNFTSNMHDTAERGPDSNHAS